MNIEELRVLGNQWANLPDCKAANEIADEVMDKLPELLQEMQQLEKAAAEMRGWIIKCTDECTEDCGCGRSHALSTSCGSSYIHRDEIKPLVEALNSHISQCCEPDGAPDGGFEYCPKCKTDLQALAHAENLLKGETK